MPAASLIAVCAASTVASAMTAQTRAGLSIVRLIWAVVPVSLDRQGELFLTVELLTRRSRLVFVECEHVGCEVTLSKIRKHRDDSLSFAEFQGDF
jgi:hypothetical protein